MKLFVRGDYRNLSKGLEFQAGQTIEVEDAMGEFLLRDAPTEFKQFDPKDYAADEFPPRPAAAAPETPPADRMVRAPRRKK